MFNLGNFGQALSMGDDYALPDGVNDALTATGSDYRIPGVTEPKPVMPEWARAAGDATKAAEGAPGLKNSPIMGLAKQAIGAVASFYTGGMAGLAMNVGGQVVGKNNPQAGAAMSAATKLF